jgi:glutamate-1-semialdehyde 2,1-aminomutase
VRPDLSGFSKAIANGYALAAVTGNDRFRDAAQQIFVTGSFWCSAMSMAAAIATLTKLQQTGAVAHMARMGQILRDGLAAQAAGYGLKLRQTGPAQMPMILFDDDPEFAKGNLFTTEALKGGVFMHPWHNMFLSAAHTEADVEEALAVTDRALLVVADQFG